MVVSATLMLAALRVGVMTFSRRSRRARAEAGAPPAFGAPALVTFARVEPK
jgi:hypothetical protein